MSSRVCRSRVAMWALSAMVGSALLGCSNRGDNPENARGSSRTLPRTRARGAGDGPDVSATVLLRDVSRSGRLADRDIGESSGLTPSSDTGVLWTHNDSGNDARIFAIDTTGRSLGSVRVRGATNTDWEAIASGPCPEGWCLYIADVGDNTRRRALVTLWRVAEPRPRDVNSTTAVRMTFRYPDGALDVEAIYVGPDTTVWLIGKRPTRSGTGRDRPARVYRITPDQWMGSGAAKGPITAELVDSLPIVPLRGDSRTWITDAALSPPRRDASRRLAVLTYGAIHVFRADPVTGRPGILFARCALGVKERNAEGLAWLPDGRLMFTNEGKAAAVYTGRCP